MENNKYLNEEKYQKNKKKITTVALIILIFGVLIGSSLIGIGLINQNKINLQYSEENQESISQQLEKEKQNLIKKKTELETKINPVETQIKNLKREPFNGFDASYYERQDKIEELEKSIQTDKESISVINKALDVMFDYCRFDQYKNNTLILKYCSLKIQLNDINSDFSKDFDSANSIPFYIFGIFVIIASCMVAGSIYMFTKKREILAFSAQQVMPIAKEGIDTITPTVSSAVGTIGKELAKGIAEGIKESKEENNE